ncbi:expressed protein [Phakopsora pachyrhizi]|uniref:Expressed protein n=1 Tax=Phakopsora pachyrhizi TaxID=170000 RepID=A0AAV0BAS0_PHAPC|nr:expressed protein [Phakopsora pachyrhizi]
MSQMTKFYAILLCFTWGNTAIEAFFSSVSWTKATAKRDILGPESAKEIPALHDAVLDAKIASFDILHSISRINSDTNIKASSVNVYKPKGPMIKLENQRKEVAYSELAASIAIKAIDLVKNYLRRVKYQKLRVHFAPEDVANNLDDIFFEWMENSFIDEFHSTLKSFENAKSSSKQTFCITDFGYCDLNGEKIYSFEELILRSLDYLLQASSSTGGEGKRIVQKVLKDSEVLKIIKSQFEKSFMNQQLEKSLFIDMEDYLKHNDWTKGFANIYDVLSKEDQHEILLNSIKTFSEVMSRKFVKYQPFFSDLKDTLIFFKDPEALNKLGNEINAENQEIARILIEFLSKPDIIDPMGVFPNIWSFSYYIVE